MRKLLQYTSLVLLANVIIFSALAQPCLNGWQYRKTIEMNNAGIGLLSHQVSLTINTQALVAVGKVRVDGGDIRFTDSTGSNLSYWYDPAEFNTPSTTFWIKANVAATSVSNIYMFYGNATSPTTASGDGTFEFFDTFNTGNISPLTWDKCGNNANVNVVGGNVTFQSNNATTPKDYLISTKQTFPSQVIAETKVNSASAGRAMVGLIDNASDGYATVYEGTVMKMMKVSLGGECKLIEQLVSPNPTSVSLIAGIMGFEWSAAAVQRITWASGATNYADSEKLASFGTAKKLVIGSSINTALTNGSFTIDYVRVRKFAVNQPVLAATVEHEAPVNPTANNTGAYCGGDDIVLSTNFYAGALYSWTGPNSFTSTSQNPAPFASSVSYDGVYSVTITMPGGCNASSITTDVEVSTASVSGTLSGAVTLCEGFNQGTLNLTGENGDILRWEMSNSAGGPWLTLSNNTNSLDYQNLADTTYYRSVVQSGACPQVISNPLQVNIDKATVGGFTLGTDMVCDGLNGGDINLVYQNGNILKWESTTDGFTWNNITSSSATESYSNLTTTTTYRAQVKSGVCPAQYSSETTITVNPNPVSDFSATTVCEGNNTQFTDMTTIPAGSIVNYNWNFGNGSGSIAQNTFNQYATYGSYSVSLTTLSDKGCSNTSTQTVNVSANPNVDYNFNNVCLGFPMSFQSVVSVPGSSITNLNWDLGDGNTSSQVNVNHTYASANTYDVTLVATSAQSCIDSITQSVVIAQPVAVDFIADSVCFGEPIQFINTSASGSANVQYSWNFGDGAISALNSPSHTYGAKGVYSVVLQASLSGNNTNCQSSKTYNVEIYERPTANFTFVDKCLSDTVSFVNQTVYTGGMSNLIYNWNFNDGNLASTQNTNHKYSLPGLYNVSMGVETVFGCTSEITKQVQIYEMPVANFNVANVCLNTISDFTNTSFINIGSMTYEWDFDNGTNSTSTSPNLVYTADGTFQVELLVTSNNGCKDTLTKAHIIHPKPLASFTFAEVCDGNVTPFTDNSSINSGSINTYNWDFGDGSSAGGTAPSHQYLNVGNYNVNLAIVSDQSCTDDTTIVAIVNPNPIADFAVQDACIGFPVGFTNNSFISSGTISNLWEFGDGASSNLASPTNMYATTGLYDVKLVVTSGKGCIDSVIKIAEVYAPPVFSLGTDITISLGDEVELEGFYSGAIAYSWSPGEGLDNSSLSNPKAKPTEETIYTLTVTDGNGCVGSDSIKIEVIDDFNLQVNNLITPDGNGSNDNWVIGNIENYGAATVYIYDRWGNEILKTTDYQNDWNGVSGTDQLPDGTYYYIISVPNQEKVYKGGLTVLRNK